jgi:hypothetical protein
MTRKHLIPAGLIATIASFFAALVLAPVQAVVQPSVQGGDIFRVRNLTAGGDFSDPATADKCQELQYRVRIHNGGSDEPLKGVNVKAVIPAAAGVQNTSSITVSASNSNPVSTSDTATVNLAQSLKITYVPGSSQLLDSNGAVISSIGDVTAGAGVNIGDVGVSINERRFVQFKAKVDCPETPPPVKNYKCEGLNVTKVDRTRFNFTATASAQNVTIQNYVFTAKNAAGQTVDTKTVTTGATTANYEFNQSTTGTYTVSVVVNTSEGPTNPADCTKQITVDEENAKKFKCEALDVKQVSRTRYDFTAKASAQNVTIQNYVFTVRKDNNTVDTKTVTTGATSADYQFDQSAEGTYIISVVVNTDAGATNPADCMKQVTVVKEGQPPVPPTTPTNPTTPSANPVSAGGRGAATAPGVLPAAGPTDVAAVVALVTTVSTIGYYVASRRLI